MTVRSTNTSDGEANCEAVIATEHTNPTPIGEKAGPTPGPWRVWVSSDAIPHHIAAEGWCIAEVQHYGFDPKRHPDAAAVQLANARLIAAAPAMYEALRGLITYFEDDDHHDEGAFDESCPDCAALNNARAALSLALPPSGRGE